jgi:hypothetical protein
MSRPAESSPSRVDQELTCAVPPPHGPHCGRGTFGSGRRMPRLSCGCAAPAAPNSSAATVARFSSENEPESDGAGTACRNFGYGAECVARCGTVWAPTKRAQHEAATERRNPGPFLWARLSGCELPRLTEAADKRKS